MLEQARRVIYIVVGAVITIALIPAIVPAYGLSRLLGIDPASMDDIGISWLTFIMITVAIVCLYVGIAIGYFL